MGSLALCFILAALCSSCGSSIAPAPQSMAQAENCRNVRSGTLVWEAGFPTAIPQVDARARAVESTLQELANQLGGTEIRRLSRLVDSTDTKSYRSEFEQADFSRSRVRIRDYQILDLKHELVRGNQLIRVHISGRICADELVDSPYLVAIGRTEGLSPDGLTVLRAELSQQLARVPMLAMADRTASSTYRDVEIEARSTGAQTQTIDRSAEIATVQAGLGYHAVAGVVPITTRVSVGVSMRALLPVQGVGLAAEERIDRDLYQQGQPTAALVTEMEREAVRLATAKLVIALSEHFRKLRDSERTQPRS